MAFKASKRRRSIFSKNHDSNIYKSFPCSGEHVRRGLDTRGGKNYEQARHTHTHTRDDYSNVNNKPLII